MIITWFYQITLHIFYYSGYGGPWCWKGLCWVFN